ncbi:MAG: helix-turn-helix transcriptional regulator [Thermodesulfobacteriota bacterium]
MVACLAAPLNDPECVFLGALCIFDAKERNFTEHCRDLLGKFRDFLQAQLKILKENALLRDALKRRFRSENSVRRLAEKLREQQIFLETIVNNTTDIICLRDGAGRWLLANSAMLEFFCLQGVEYQGRTNEELARYSERYRYVFAACSASDENAWRRRDVLRQEEVILLPDGEQRFFDVMKTPLFRHGGERYVLLVAARDMTMFRQVEKTLRAREELLAGILRSSPVGMGFIVKGVTQWVNPKLEEITGFCAAELTGSTLPDRQISFCDFIKNSMARMLPAGRNITASLETRWRRKDGAMIDILLNLTFLDPDGMDKGVVCAVLDITDRKKMAIRLAEANVQLEQQVAQRTKELQRKSSEQCRTLAKLEETNIALRVLLENSRHNRQESEQKIVANIKERILPYLEDIEAVSLDGKRSEYIDIIRKNIEEITSSFTCELASRAIGLTPRELQIADLVRHGRTNKEIAALLHLSHGTVELHRNAIRKKLGLNNRKINLRSYLRERF